MKAIYIRTSTEEQEPENQIKDIELISGKDYLLFKDKQSAWKDNLDREQFTNLKKDIQLKKISELYVWDLDRIFRNRKKLIEFFELCKLYKCKIHSYRQQWLEQLNNIPEPFNEIMHSLMVQIMGWLAEEESNKKSERIKVSIRRNQGITSSYKGNKWGRKSRELDGEIIKLIDKGLKYREIQENILYLC
jgi:DNA invertase Pin-like site-specific DNA recombinase